MNQTGLTALRRWNCQVVILDDGFQYLKLARDIDIVTVDATRPFGLGHVLPRGYLREPLSALNRADLILLTRVDQCENLDSVRDRLNQIAPSVPIFESVPQSELKVGHAIVGMPALLKLSLVRERRIHLRQRGRRTGSDNNDRYEDEV